MGSVRATPVADRDDPAGMALAVLVAAPSAQAPGFEVQSLDGSGNNQANPSWGRAGTNSLRVAAARRRAADAASHLTQRTGTPAAPPPHPPQWTFGPPAGAGREPPAGRRGTSRGSPRRWGGSRRPRTCRSTAGRSGPRRTQPAAAWP